MIENGLVSGSPALVGGNVTVTCNTGYLLMGGEATVDCLADCMYSGTPSCEPVGCPGQYVPNSYNLSEGLFSDTVEVQCLPGYMANSSSISFNVPCATSFMATCAADGNWSYDTICIPLMCPPYNMEDASLKCDDEDKCSVTDIPVGTAQPSMGVSYLEFVTIQCNAGYELVPYNDADGYDATELSQCTSTCQYTSNTRSCQPRQCEDFSPLGFATVDMTSQFHLKSLTYRCNDGYAINGQEHTWSNCQDDQEVMCNLNQPSNATAGVFAGIANETHFRLASTAAAHAGAYRGMTLLVGNEEINIIASFDRTVVVARPFQTTPSVGTRYRVLSVFSPPQSDLLCSRVTHACGAYSVPVGTYVPPDPNVEQDSAEPATVVQGGEIRLSCIDGYRVVGEEQEFSCSTNGRVPGCTESEATLYIRKCGGCRYYSTQMCKIVECSPHEPDAVSEETSAANTALFGETVTVQCKPGFKTGVELVDGARGVAPGPVGFTSYTRLCGVADLNQANDRILQAASPTLCLPVTCGAFAMLPNMSLVLAVPNWTATTEYVHSDAPLVLECNPGYRRNDTVSTFAAPCNGTIMAWCLEGAWMYNAPGGEEPSQMDPPVCVPMECGEAMDECGSETCEASQSLEEGAMLTDSTAMSLQVGEQQEVMCQVGFRAAPEALEAGAEVMCSLPQNYSRTCGYCIVDAAEGCRPVTCMAGQMVDANGHVAADGLLTYMANTSVECALGFRASTADMPRTDAPKSFAVICRDNCSLTPMDSAMRCRGVVCPVMSIANATRSDSSNPNVTMSTALTEGQVLRYTCNPGYKRNLTTSSLSGPCNASIWTKCVDGVSMYSTNGMDFDMDEVPACVPIEGCATSSEVCGQEGCAAYVAGSNSAIVGNVSVLQHASSLSVQCNEGYRAGPMNDMTPLTCADPSTFTVGCSWCSFNQQHECRPIQCSWDPTQDPNGVAATTTATFGGSVTVECSHGFRASDNHFSTSADPRTYDPVCNVNCSFGGAVGCKPIRCPDFEIGNASVTLAGNMLYDSNGTLEVGQGDNLTYTCDPGYQSSPPLLFQCSQQLHGVCLDGHIELQHLESAESSSCRPKTCPALNESLFPDASVPASGPMGIAGPPGKDEFGVNITCNDGFRVGPSTSVLPSGMKSFVVNCTNCLWNLVNVSRCVKGKCAAFNDTQPPAFVESFSPMFANTDGVDYGEKVEVKCQEGYRINGNNERQEGDIECTDEGYSPSNMSEVCTKLQCDAFTAPENSVEIPPARTPVLWGDTQTYQCNSGFNVEGSYCWETVGAAMCDAEGGWDALPCIETHPTQDCFLRDEFADPPSPELSDKTVTTIRCQELHAAAPRTALEYVLCNENLTTTYEVNCTSCHPERSAVCKPLACPMANWTMMDPNIVSWTPQERSMVGDTVRLMCAEGFRGGDEASDGCTSEEDERAYCPPSAPRELLVQCDASSAVHCGFTDLKLKCKPVTCGPAPMIMNGAAELQADGEMSVYGDSITVTCDEGFRVAMNDDDTDGECSTEGTAECRADGMWEPISCVPVRCMTPQGNGVIRVPDVASIGFGETVRASCDRGFATGDGMQGVLECTDDCTLDSPLSCARVQCEVEEPLSNAEMLVDPPILFPMTVPVLCNEGYVAEGAGGFVNGRCLRQFNRQCLFDGSMSLPTVQCVVATCPSAAEQFAGMEGLGSFVADASLILDHSDPRTFADAQYGFSVTVECAEGYSVNDSVGADMQTSFTLSCGGGYDGEDEESSAQCLWEQPTVTCLPRGECPAFSAWNETTVTMTSDGRVEGTCPVDKLSASGQACGRSWAAVCVWHAEAEMWVWAYEGTEVLHADASPCSRNATCIVPDMANVEFMLGGEELEEGDQVMPGTSVQWQCTRGYVGVGGVHEGMTQCMAETCSMSPAPPQCAPDTCLADTLLQEFDFTTAREQPIEYGQQVPVGQQIQIECREGYTLDLGDGMRDDDVVIGGETLPVLAQEQFPPPSSTAETTYRLSGFPSITIRFPPGAWPVGETRPLRLSLLDITPSSRLFASAERGGRRRVAGRGIFYEPSGIQFLQPVELALPYYVDTDFGDLELYVHVFDLTTGNWTRKPYSNRKAFPVDSVAGVVYAETMTFSTYASIAVPPAVVTTTPAITTTTANVSFIETTAPQTEPMTTTPVSVVAEDEDEGGSNRVGVIVGSVIGGLVGLILLVWGCYSCQKQGMFQKKEGEGTQEPLVINPVVDAPAGAMPAEEEAKRDVEISPQGPPYQPLPTATRDLPQATQTPGQEEASRFLAAAPEPVEPSVPELGQQAVRQRELDTAPPTMAMPMPPPPPEPAQTSETELQQLLAEARRKDEEERMLAGMLPEMPGQERWKPPIETTFSQRGIASNPPVDPPPPLAPGAITLAMQRQEPESVMDTYGGVDFPTTPRDAPTVATEEKSPFDTLSIADIASLLPPGWLCCVGCAQPVNSCWNKCPKCGTVPGMAPSGTM